MHIRFFAEMILSVSVLHILQSAPLGYKPPFRLLRSSYRSSRPACQPNLFLLLCQRDFFQPLTRSAVHPVKTVPNHTPNVKNLPCQLPVYLFSADDHKMQDLPLCILESPDPLLLSGLSFAQYQEMLSALRHTL